MIRYAEPKDTQLLKMHDKHISGEELSNCVKQKRIIVMFEENSFIGCLRYNLFWDNIPFMNMLYIMDEERNKGNGRRLLRFWEDEMKKKGFDFVMTSTQSDEQAQFFYRKLGYADVGSLILPKEPLEIIFYKNIQE